MSTFTMPLKTVIELTGGTIELDEATGISKLIDGNIGLGFYPIFDETYRDTLTGKIVDHYLNREIGQETIPMFQLAMRRKMNEIMPFYNKLYESEKIDFDPLSTVDLTTINSGQSNQEGNVSGTNNTATTNESGSRSVTSETPQTMLNGSGDYATGAADVNSKTVVSGEGTEESSNTSSVTDSSESTTKGFQGIGSELLMRYRESLLNIDLMVINDLEECFMLIWDNGDSYTKGFSL